MTLTLELLESLTWAPFIIPTSIDIKSIPSQHVLRLEASLTAALSSAATETGLGNLKSLSQVARGAQASLTVISAEQVHATATDPGVKETAYQAIRMASLNLQYLKDERNLYGTDLNLAPNVIFFVIFTLCFVYTTAMIVKSRYHWFNITFFAGELLQFIGWLGRILAYGDTSNLNYYLMQYIGLTISPAFLMGGIYFLFAQLVVVHGREYSVLKPLWYSYLFVTSDVISLLIQSGGGAASSIATQINTDPKPGTNAMTAGIAFQVAAMTVFLFFWFEFLNRIYFKPAKNIEASPYSKRSFKNFLRLLFNRKLIRDYRKTSLESCYNAKYADIRSRPLFDWFPLVITISVLFVYVRSVYRIVELAQGFLGYLIKHEVYLMILDAFLIAMTCLLFVPFHPFWVFGADNKMKLAHIKNRVDVEAVEEETESSSTCKEAP